MRIVIDKDYCERKLLQESYEAKKPTYGVRAVNPYDKFIYAKGLKNINEAVESVYDLAFDPLFDECYSEIVECVDGKDELEGRATSIAKDWSIWQGRGREKRFLSPSWPSRNTIA